MPSLSPYLIDVMVTYTNTEGDTVNSATETVGVPVGSKLGFVVTSAPVFISPGQSKVIEVEYQNTGSITAYHALARLTTVDPLTSPDTMAYLGDIIPGQKVTALYTITANSKATPAIYNLDTNVRYRDSLDDSLTSDTVSAQVEVVQPAPGSLLPVLAAAVMIAAILIGAGDDVVVMRRKR